MTELLKFIERFQEKRYKYFLILFQWTRRMQFWKLCLIFLLPKGPKIVSQGAENTRKKTKLSSRLPYGIEKTVSTTRRKVSTKARKFFAQWLNYYIFKNDFKKKNKKSLKMFPWTRRMQFWQPCWKYSDKRLKTVPPLSIRKEGKFQRTKKNSRVCYRHLKMLFWQPYRKRFNRKPHLFSIKNLLKKIRIPKKLYLSQNAPLHM